MSNARPMTDDRRRDIYLASTRHPFELGRLEGMLSDPAHTRAVVDLTQRQWRQYIRKQTRNANCPSGASGVPVRRPIARGSRTEFVSTHVAEYCAPCAKHFRPRLHSRPRLVGVS